MRANIALLHGGGLESNLIFYILMTLKKPFDVVWVDYGQASHKEEFNVIKKKCAKYKINMVKLSMPFIKQQSKSLLFGTGDSHIVNGRNFYFTTEVLKYYDHVYLGTTSKDVAPDASEKYVNSIQEIVAMAFQGTKSVVFPLYNEDVMMMGKSLLQKIPDAKEFIFSCWTPFKGEACGECKHCLKIKELG